MALALAWGSLVGCDAAPTDPTDKTVEYRLTWNTDGVTFGEDGIQWVTNLGFEITLEEAYLVTYSTQLVPCDKETTLVLTQLWRWVVGVAHAGHGGSRDPSAIAVSRAESLLTPEPIELGRRNLRNEVYCQLHYLVGPAEPNTIGLPTAFDLDGISLYLRGHWRPEGGSDGVPFTIAPPNAYGTLTYFYPPEKFGTETARFPLDVDASGARVVIERSLGTLLDDVDWPTMAERDVAGQALKNLVGQVKTALVPTAD